jgi:hypothetical protein
MNLTGAGAGVAATGVAAGTPVDCSTPTALARQSSSAVMYLYQCNPYIYSQKLDAYKSIAR